MSLLKALVLVAGQIVQLPSGDTVGDFNTLANKPTTIAGYGITAASVLSSLLTVDGAGSGLDADLLDGNSSAFFLDVGNATGTLAAARIADNTLPVAKHNFTATSRILGRATAGAGAGEELTGAQVLSIAGGLAASSYTAADVLAKMLTVDGAGSGLDADLLDGLSSAAFAQRGAVNTFVGDQTLERSGDITTGLLFFGNSGSRYLWMDGTTFNFVGVGLTVLGSTVWTSGNDGAGSGLDADLLDAQSGAFYLDLGNATGTIATAQIAANAVTVAKMLQLADQRILGNVSGATANMTGLTAAQVATMIAGSFGAITMTGNLSIAGAIIGTGANLDIRKDTLAAADTEAIRIGAGGVIGSTRGATLQLFGVDHATQPGNFLLQAGIGSIKPTGANIGGILFGTKTFDFASITNVSTGTTTVTVTGAAVGDVAIAGLTTLTTQLAHITASVSAANTVTVKIYNNTGAAFDPASGTLNVFVFAAP